MARVRRASPIGIPQHRIQRGNNRQVCFADEADMKAYLAWLSEQKINGKNQWGQTRLV
jgi:REP-associated tyrosine transposase